MRLANVSSVKRVTRLLNEFVMVMLSGGAPAIVAHDEELAVPRKPGVDADAG